MLGIAEKLTYCIAQYAKRRRQKERQQAYYYVVESARVEGKPGIVHQAYLGTAEKLAEMVRDHTAPVPLAAALREFGLPAALWSAAQQTGVWDWLQSLWPAPRSAPSPAHYLLLAAMRRVCQPGPKTEVAEWYRQSILAALWGFAPERFTFQAFWDAFEQILPEEQQDLPVERDPLEKAQLALLGLVEGKTAGQSAAAGIRHHRLLYLHRQHQYPQSTGAAWPQQARPTQPAASRT